MSGYCIFMTALTVFYRAWYSFVHILQILPKALKVQWAAFVENAVCLFMGQYNEAETCF